MKVKPPKIDKRLFGDIEDTLHGLVPHYTPEWAASDKKDPGVALIKIFSHMTENIIHRLNQVPQKNFVAFLDMLGIKLLPAQPARAPVTFILAKGSDREVLIPERTQVSAEKTDEHEELPFETEANLMATPSQLIKVFGIDPINDRIYDTPQDFLDINSKSKSSTTYKIISLASKGTKYFQLDHVTDLKEKDILKISDSSSEYVIVSSLAATIVKTEDKLEFDHSPDTKVEKIVKFNPFEGKDRQEHILYLGHKDLFNIKGKAQFNLQVTNRAGTETEVMLLKNFAWEYWGEEKEEGAKDGKNEDDWYELGFIDYTEGFARNGIIQLNKTKDGEIKEREINGMKSRWIRCKLKDKLGVDISRKLPELDNIVFTVKSQGENLLPDLAFNNDTPLDVNKKFTPFGKEPRMFDIFAIGSKDVFSKKEAKIKIDVEVEPRELFGGPIAIPYEGKIKIFAWRYSGRLKEVEIDIDSKTSKWTDHEFPANSKIAHKSTPSVVTNYSVSGTSLKFKFISVIARDDKGNLVEKFFNGNFWREWDDHNRIIIDNVTPAEGINVDFDPAAIYNETPYQKIISVFVIGKDGNLYEFYRSPDKIEGKWLNHNNDNISFASSPYAESYVSSASYDYASVGSVSRVIRVKVFIKGQDGKLYELDCKAGSNDDDKWMNYKAPKLSSKSVLVDSKPFAVIYPEYDPVSSRDIYYAKVFVIGDNGKLYKYNTRERIKKWIDLGQPSDKVSIDSNPHGHLIKPDSEDGAYEGKHIFIIGSDNLLWEMLWKTKNVWESHEPPSNSKLYLSPFVIVDTKNQQHIFSGSNQISIIERRIGLNDAKKIWNIINDPDEIRPSLSWEYWNKTAWGVLKGINDETSTLLKDGKITFDLPKDIEETEIAGQKNYWIKARIVGGNYGTEEFTLIQETKKLKETAEQKLISTKDTIRPPIINKLKINYSIEKNKDPEYCMTYNNLECINQTEASKIKDKFFEPFVQLEDKNLSIYLGFDNILKSGPLRIFFAAKELQFTEKNKPKIEWSYSIKNDWSELKGCSDDTEGLIKGDIFEFAGPSDFSKLPRFGNPLFWIKGALTKGNYEKENYPLLDGIYPNTTWASQEETIRDEILGSSSGLPDQIFALLRLPVLDGEEIRVREILTDQEIQDINKNHEKDELEPIFPIKDETGKVIENWVLWKRVSDFFDSTEKDRHYMLDQTTGKIQFGNGTDGMIPQPGDNNIKAVSYQTGGGSQGNIKKSEIKSIKSSVPGVDKVLNFAAADGGSDAAPLDQMLEIGPAMIGHRNRAITWEDFEWVAKKASRKIAKVKCLPNRSNRLVDKEHIKEIGWVTLIIVPDEKIPQPTPSLELKRQVRKYLENHGANTLASVQHIWVDGPAYVEISVSMDVFVTLIDRISEVEREVKKKLGEFFHPLTGGPENNGWEFGRDVNVSDIYALISEIKWVDHVEKLRLEYSGSVGNERLFSWNEIPGEDDHRLIKYLKNNFEMDWIETANIRNSDHLKVSLLSWDEFFSKENRKLIEFVTRNFNANWVRNANIDKSAPDKDAIKIFNTKDCLSLKLNNDKSRIKATINDTRAEDLIVNKENGKLMIRTRTIRISDGEHFLLIKLSNDETKVFLMIDDGRIDEFIARNENGRLNIYNRDIVEIKPDFLVANGKHTINTQVIKAGE
jgi:hypothetical protein